MSRDYISYWYEARVKYGGCDTIQLSWFNPLTENPHDNYVDFHHRAFDGVGAIEFYLRSIGIAYQKPEKSNNVPPTLLTLFKILFRSYGVNNYDSLPWRYKTIESEYYDTVLKSPIEVACLSMETTQLLLKACEKKNISLNALLLSAANNMVHEHLLDDMTCESNVVVPWMVPINMRGDVRLSNPFANHTSAIMVFLNNNSSPKEIGETIRRNLKKGMNWKLWMLGNCGWAIGKSGVSWLYKKGINSRWYGGSCTFIGNWNSKKMSLNDDKVLVVIGLGSPQYPVTPSSIIWNDQLVLSLKIDKTIMPGSQENSNRKCSDCMQAWKNNIFSEMR